MDAVEGTVSQEHLTALRERMGTRDIPSQVGYAAANQADHDQGHYKNYCSSFDFNNDGVIDEQDEAALTRHLGRRVRYNAYFHAYFGGDWLTTQVSLQPDHEPGAEAIADYTYGGGYDAQAGVIRLLQTPGPNQPVWVEYHHDAPAEAGADNIRIHLYHEVD